MVLPHERELDVWPTFSNSRLTSGAWEFSGHADPQLHGERDAPLAHVLFHLANYPRSVFGTSDDPTFRTRSVGAGWELTLDAVQDYEARTRAVRVSRGGAVTHVGRLRRAGGEELTWDELAVPLEAARFLLSFVAGHRVAPLFAVGMTADGRRAVEEWGAYRRDPFGGVLNWCTKLFRGEAVRALWEPVLTMSADPDTRQLLTIALELYLDVQQGRTVSTARTHHGGCAVCSNGLVSTLAYRTRSRQST